MHKIPIIPQFQICNRHFQADIQYSKTILFFHYTINFNNAFCSFCREISSKPHFPSSMFASWNIVLLITSLSLTFSNKFHFISWCPSNSSFATSGHNRFFKVETNLSTSFADIKQDFKWLTFKIKVFWGRHGRQPILCWNLRVVLLLLGITYLFSIMSCSICHIWQ